MVNFEYLSIMLKVEVKTILFFTITGCFLSYGLTAKADLFGDYVDYDTQEVEQRRTVGSGSRSDSCQSNINENSVSLLVPEREVVHNTSRERPSFFITTDKSSSTTPFKFTLVNPKTGKTLVEKDFSVSRGGIEKIELPKTTKLKYNEIYLWHVAIPCKNKPNEYREVLGAAIKRRQLSKKLETQIQKSENELQTAAIYAENGFWYDAVELAAKEENRLDPGSSSKINSSNYLDRLLNSAGISLQH